MAKIGVFAGDGGGGNEVVGIGIELAKVGHEIDWRVSPENDLNGVIAKAGTVAFDKNGINYSRQLPTVDDNFDLIIIGTSATATALQVAGTEFANAHRIPCVHVEDFPGCGNYLKVRETCSPDVMCVVDEESKKIAHNVRPSLDVRVCGKPSYAKDVGPMLRPIENCLAVRQEVRDRLGFSDETLVVTVSLGITIDTLVPQLEVIAGLGDISGRQTVLLSRIHPKCPEYVKKAAQDVLLDSNTKVVDSSSFGLVRVVIASDIFVCTWGSTEQFCASLANVVPLLDLGDEKEFEKRKELGYLNGVPPLVHACAGWGFHTTTEMAELIRNTARDLSVAKELIKKTSTNFESWITQGATGRIVDVCLDILGKNK